MATTVPMSGQMSIAPMMASVESRLRPIEAMIMAAMSWQMCMPSISAPSRTRSWIWV